MRFIALTVLILAAVPPFASAQEAVFNHEIRASAALGLAPRTFAGAPTLALPAAPPLAASRRRDKSLGVTLMVIGGGAVVVGAIAGGGGGTVLIVGGLVCAGYGFYLYTE